MGLAYAFFSVAYGHPLHSLFLPLELIYSIAHVFYGNAENVQITDPNNLVVGYFVE
ncbi:hypothetical protein VINE108521_10575 [Vibrio neonatus]